MKKRHSRILIALFNFRCNLPLTSFCQKKNRKQNRTFFFVPTARFNPVYDCWQTALSQIHLEELRADSNFYCHRHCLCLCLCLTPLQREPRRRWQSTLKKKNLAPKKMLEEVCPDKRWPTRKRNTRKGLFIFKNGELKTFSLNLLNLSKNCK